LRNEAGDFVRETARLVLGLKPAIVGCTSTFQQHCAGLALLREVKKQNPEVLTMMGGANCEGKMGLATLQSFPWLDVVVSGEADLLIPELVIKMSQGKLDELPYGALSRACSPPGVPRAKVLDLDQVPVPDFDHYFEALNRSRWKNAIKPGLVMEGSRGCWWGAKHHCTFCGLNGTGMGYRPKSGDRVLEEMETLSLRHSIKEVEMADNILHMEAFKTFLPQLAERGAPYNIFYEVKANLSREQVRMLARAGVGWVQPGLESMDDQVLKLLDKGTTALQNVRFLRYTREFGVRVTWLMLSQVPGEEDSWYEEMVRWLPYISHLQPPARAVPLRYDRFSPYQSRPDDYGLRIAPDPSYAFVYPPQTDLENLAYFFEDEEGTCPPGREPAESRRGLDALNRLISQWVARFWRWPDLLCMTENDNAVTILDTRPVAFEKQTVLRGLPAEVLKLCDSPRSSTWLHDNLNGDLESAIEELERRKLLLAFDGKYLSLPVAGKIPTLPDRLSFPGGRTLAKTPPVPEGNKELPAFGAL
jgi:magnesium-protoporphyrin IX monomethyl ester (oxidative) cyclase